MTNEFRSYSEKELSAIDFKKAEISFAKGLIEDMKDEIESFERRIERLENWLKNPVGNHPDIGWEKYPNG